MQSPTLALIGCGAVAETFHIPALCKRPELLRSLVLVDPDLERARAIRERIGAADAVSDYREVLSRVQGALIATPHGLHHRLTMECVRAGVHVLCEKPLAESALEVDEIVRAAAEHRVHVAVNQTRRFFSSFQAVHGLITSGELGDVREIDYVLGEPFAWPAATATYFGVKSGGKGVLFDTGAHIIDLVCWWLGGRPELVDYADDSYGGTEAVAKITLLHGGAAANVQLSWLTKLRNTYRVVGSRASVEGGVYEWSSYSIRKGSGRARKVRTDSASRMLTDFPEMLLENFTRAVAGKEAPRVPASATRDSIAVIEACYANRKRLPAPWQDACERLAHV